MERSRRKDKIVLLLPTGKVDEIYDSHISNSARRIVAAIASNRFESLNISGERVALLLSHIPRHAIKLCFVPMHRDYGFLLHQLRFDNPALGSEEVQE